MAAGDEEHYQQAGCDTKKSAPDMVIREQVVDRNEGYKERDCITWLSWLLCYHLIRPITLREKKGHSSLLVRMVM
jgi:hypothetical protein